MLQTEKDKHKIISYKRIEKKKKRKNHGIINYQELKMNIA